MALKIPWKSASPLYTKIDFGDKSCVYYQKAQPLSFPFSFWNVRNARKGNFYNFFSLVHYLFFFKEISISQNIDARDILKKAPLAASLRMRPKYLLWSSVERERQEILRPPSIMPSPKVLSAGPCRWRSSFQPTDEIFTWTTRSVPLESNAV